MRVAVIGSRSLIVTNLKKYMPPNTTEIVSGGAKGVDSSAKAYKCFSGIKIKHFIPRHFGGRLDYAHGKFCRYDYEGFSELVFTKTARYYATN